MKQIESKKEVSLGGLSLLAKDLRGWFKKPQVLLLSGSLGTGKTTFTQVLLKQIIGGEGRGLVQSGDQRTQSHPLSPATHGLPCGEGRGLVQSGDQRTVPQTVSPPTRHPTFVKQTGKAWQKSLIDSKGSHPLSPATRGSPAFSIQHVYGSDYGDIYHLDMYRLKDSEDLESTGFWDIFLDEEKTYLVIIEWADRLNLDCLPLAWNYIKLTFLFGKSEGTRNIKILRS